MDFLILKVNGQDVSKASHEDAVRAFQAAQEPIVVEVLRRAAAGGIRSDANRNLKPEPTPPDEGVTVSTQTEPWRWPCSPDFPPAPPFGDEDDIDESFDDVCEPEVDFEEVTLVRASTSERLGLTLYYPDGDDATEETDVLVQNVESGGIAARDGRIQPGDQIIQINGEDVSSKEQAERLLSAKPDVVLLVCRPGSQDEAPVDQNEADVDINRSPQSSCQRNLDNRVSDFISPPGERGSLEKRDSMKSGCSSSSSGSSSGGSCGGGGGGCSTSRPPPSACEASNTIDRELYTINKQMVVIRQECDALAQRRATRRDVEDHIYETIPECTESDEPLYCQPYVPGGAKVSPVTAPLSRSRRDVERWVKASVPPPPPEREVEEAWVQTSSTNDSRSSADSTSRQPRRTRSLGEEKDNSSSAYNTGDSSRSTPLTLELGLVTDETAARETRESTLTLAAPAHTAAPTKDLSLQVSLDSDTYSEVSCKNCRKCMRLPPLQAPTPTKNKNIINSVNTVEKNRNYVTFLPYQTHYTNAANLEETMHRQQRQLYQQVLRRGQSPRTPPAGTAIPTHSLPTTPSRPVAPVAPFGASLRQYRYISSPSGAPRNHSHTLPADGGAGDDPQFQYKVKVRSDGSRYIARRPVRKQLLKERAARINEERAGITTDDDAMSELKLGRYWPRDEKKRQLERSRERKLKQQQRTKMAAVPEEGGSPDDLSPAKRQGIPGVESSLQRRSTTSSMRKKPLPGQEEFLKHAKPPKPNSDTLLSVTTV